jgi:Glycosyltransferases, probably involved in cell wall biogenesis
MQSVSILIPCYQERNFIRSCLDSVREFEVPGGVSVEVLVLDGMSTDGTREIVSEIAAADPRIRLVDNPNRTQSAALNLAIPMAKGEYIMRLDAHSFYPKDYLAHCVETAIRTGADNTGGVVATLRRGSGYQSALVQALTTHVFGVGDSGFRTEAAEGKADTVPYGFFRKDVFGRVGLFDERLLRAQDYEMNRRIIAAGGTVWMNPTIRVQYYQQPDMRSFIRKQFVHEAPYNAYMWYLAPYSFTIRHAITGLFAFGVIAGLILSAYFPVIRIIFLGTMALYFALAVGAGAQQAFRYREPRHVIFAPLAFFAYHFLHGLGVLVGLARLATGTAPVQGKAEPWPGAGRFRAWPVPSSSQVR